MAYDEVLAARVRVLVQPLAGMTERKMFGGIGFMLGGNMAVGVPADERIGRNDPDEHEAALRDPLVRPFEVGGRSMKAWLLVAPEGTRTPARLTRWVARATAYAASLPPKR
jgi:TfoX/Sxy family transcriptional regulator of competence genes